MVSYVNIYLGVFLKYIIGGDMQITIEVNNTKLAKKY